MNIRLLAIEGATVCLFGCGGDSNQMQFHGEQPLLPDFAFDTGLQPSGSPVQLELSFSAGGALTADASATAGGEGNAVTVAGTPGSGLFALDGHIKLDGMLHIDVSGLKYDGPIPGIETIDVAFAGQTVFDPFLLDDKADLSVKLPKIDFPPIPLPGGLPGTLQISISAGSTLDSKLSGTCAGMTASSVQFLASTATSGNLVLASKIVLKVPVIGDKTFSIPDVTVAIPSVTAAMDLGTQTFSAGGATPVGSSIATPGACDDSGSGGHGGGDGGGDETCTASVDPYAPTWHPPNGFHANQCGDNQLAAFSTACLASTATSQTCSDFEAGNLTCFQCLVTPSTAPGYGAIVRYPELLMLDVGGCFALTVPSQLACGESIEAFYDCVADACSGCADSSSTDVNACLTAAQAGRCSALVQAATDCENAAQTSAPNCFDFAATARSFCGP